MLLQYIVYQLYIAYELLKLCGGSSDSVDYLYDELGNSDNVPDAKSERHDGEFMFAGIRQVSGNLRTLKRKSGGWKSRRGRGRSALSLMSWQES